VQAEAGDLRPMGVPIAVDGSNADFFPVEEADRRQEEKKSRDEFEPINDHTARGQK
jgi:hypothetical protein